MPVHCRESGSRSYGLSWAELGAYLSCKPAHYLQVLLGEPSGSCFSAANTSTKCLMFPCRGCMGWVCSYKTSLGRGMRARKRLGSANEPIRILSRSHVAPALQFAWRSTAPHIQLGKQHGPYSESRGSRMSRHWIAFPLGWPRLGGSAQPTTLRALMMTSERAHYVVLPA